MSLGYGHAHPPLRATGTVEAVFQVGSLGGSAARPVHEAFLRHFALDRETLPLLTLDVHDWVNPFS